MRPRVCWHSICVRHLSSNYIRRGYRGRPFRHCFYRKTGRFLNTIFYIISNNDHHALKVLFIVTMFRFITWFSLLLSTFNIHKKCTAVFTENIWVLSWFTFSSSIVMIGLHQLCPTRGRVEGFFVFFLSFNLTPHIALSFRLKIAISIAASHTTFKSFSLICSGNLTPISSIPVVPNLCWCIPPFAHFGTFHSSPMERPFLPCSGSYY